MDNAKLLGVARETMADRQQISTELGQALELLGPNPETPAVVTYLLEAVGRLVAASEADAKLLTALVEHAVTRES